MKVNFVTFSYQSFGIDNNKMPHPQNLFRLAMGMAQDYLPLRLDDFYFLLVLEDPFFSICGFCLKSIQNVDAKIDAIQQSANSEAPSWPLSSTAPCIEFRQLYVHSPARQQSETHPFKSWCSQYTHNPKIIQKFFDLQSDLAATLLSRPTSVPACETFDGHFASGGEALHHRRLLRRRGHGVHHGLSSHLGCFWEVEARGGTPPVINSVITCCEHVINPHSL